MIGRSSMVANRPPGESRAAINVEEIHDTTPPHKIWKGHSIGDDYLTGGWFSIISTQGLFITICVFRYAASASKWGAEDPVPGRPPVPDGTPADDGLGLPAGQIRLVPYAVMSALHQSSLWVPIDWPLP
jgi:hypothetical protein